jgi:hypothetical protein
MIFPSQQNKPKFNVSQYRPIHSLAPIMNRMDFALRYLNEKSIETCDQRPNHHLHHLCGLYNPIIWVGICCTYYALEIWNSISHLE